MQPNQQLQSQKLLWLSGLGFILLNSICISQEIWAVPLLSGLCLLIYLATFALDKLFYFITFLTPLSILYEDADLHISFTLPTEPILFGIMLIFWLRYLISSKIDNRVLKHPITILILLHLGWMSFSIFTSTLPLVSLKFFLSNLWFITTFYFLAAEIFQKKENIARFFWLYTIPMAAVCVYTLINHSRYFFSHMVSSEVMQPFILNHAIYGAVLAILLCFLFIVQLNLALFTKKPLMGIPVAIILVIIIVALIFSYTRAAWLSVAIAIAYYFLLKLRIPFNALLLSLFTALILFFTFQTEILLALQKNNTDSSTKLDKHVQSISNIKTDASNLERLNRWACAVRMVKEKPFLGWGPGTYMFKYAPFQKPNEKTIISTNSGDVGGVHSEYLGPLVETGIPGLLIFIGLVLTILKRGMQVIYNANSPLSEALGRFVFLGLITYLSHGFLNNYLDIDKTACLFWASLAAITQLDLQNSRPLKTD